MNKAYFTVLKVVAFILTFVIGMVSSILILVGAGYVAADKVSLNKLENMGINVDTSALFNDQAAEKPIRDMSLVQLIGQIKEIGEMADVTTFNTLSQTYGLVVPAEGESDTFDAMRDVPFSILFTEEGVDKIMSKILLGEMMGFDKIENPHYDESDPNSKPHVWYDPVNERNVWALEGVFCDYTIYDIVYNIDVREEIGHVPVGDILDYDYIGENWYYENGEPVKGIMAVVADRTIDDLSSTLEETPMGDLLGYERNEETGKWHDPEDSNNEVHPFMQLVADSKFSEIDQIYDRVTIADLVPESERQTGYISLVDPDTHLSEVSTEVNRVFAEATLEQLVDCGALELTASEKEALEYNPTLKQLTMSEMLSYILNTNTGTP